MHPRLKSTVTAEMVQPDTLAMSHGALGAVNGTAKFISSTTVGVLWTAVSPGLLICVFLAPTLALDIVILKSELQYYTNKTNLVRIN